MGNLALLNLGLNCDVGAVPPHHNSDLKTHLGLVQDVSLCKLIERVAK